MFTGDFFQYDADSSKRTSDIAMGDLNGDGHLDLVSIGYPVRGYSVFLGDGSGVFSSHNDYPMSGQSGSVNLGDLNGDTHLDLVLTEFPAYGQGKIWVFLGVGDGSFGPGTSFPDNQGPTASAIGDVNGDGKLDVAVVHFARNPSLFSVLLGNGDGTLQPKTDYPTLGDCNRIILADLNGDGNLEALVGINSYEVTVFPGTGGGNFGLPAHYSMSQAYMTLGDLNGDGHFDLVTSTIGGGSPATTIKVRLGNANGTFGDATTYATSNGPQQPRIVDLTEDGKPDVALGSFGGMSLLPGDGNGGLGASNYVYAGTDPSNLMIGDLNEDGHLDAAMNGSGLAVLLLNRGAPLGHTSSTRISIHDLPGANGLAIGDFDEDGHLDAVTNSSYTRISLVRGYGLAGFGGQRDFLYSSRVISIRTADLNGDHHLDLVVGTSSASAKFSVLLGDGHGGFGAATDYPLPNVSGSGYYVAIGDVSGDGILDVVVSGGNVPGVSVLLGLGNGSLGPRLDVASSGSVSAIACADLNNDQLADVVFVGNNTLSIVLSVGDGYFDPKIDFPLSIPASPAIGDLNGDSRPDIVCGSSPSTLVLLFQNPDGTFGPPVNLAFGLVSVSGPKEIADVNGDGHPDVVIANDGATVLLGHGNGTFDSARKFGFKNGNVLGVGDWSGDGRPELIVAGGSGVNNADTFIAVLYNQLGGAYPTAVPALASPTASWLMDPRPNPSWAGFTVDYVLPHAAPTTIEIFDPSGRRVRVLAPTRVMPPGPHTTTWDGRGEDGVRLHPGVYWLSVTAGAQRAARRAVMIQ
jgi:hypothetical protein